jgi:ABC-type oligopeptide transport system substrate-binding subunit
MPVPEHIIQQYGDTWTAPDHLVGNGPFCIAGSPSETSFLLRKNPTYWDRERVMLDSVMYHILNDSATAIRQYERGEIDWLSWITTHEMSNVLGHPDLLRFPVLGTYYYNFNTARPVLNDSRVRKALYLAVNRGTICRTMLKSGDRPAFGIVPPYIPGYVNAQGERENSELARQLFAETGYPNGQGFPELSLLYFEHEEHQLIAEAVQAMWQNELNIHVRLEPQQDQIYRQKMRERDFDLLNSLWVGDYVDPGTFLDMFQSASHDNNLTGWESHKYRTLIQQAKTEIDPEKRLQVYAQAEQILIDQAPIIPLFHTVAVQLVKPYINGIKPNLMNLHPFKEVKTTR